MDVHKTLYPFYTKENTPCYGNNHKKNALLAAVARYISFTTIYTVGYLQIFNTGHFFSSRHWHIAMIYKEKSVGFPWFSTKTQIMTLFYLERRAAPSWIFSWTNNWTCFWKFRGGLPVALPLIAVSASKTCQHHLETRAAKVWDLVQSDQWKPATQTGQLSRPVCWHDYGQLTRIRTPRRFCKIDQMNY